MFVLVSPLLVKTNNPNTHFGVLFTFPFGNVTAFALILILILINIGLLRGREYR